MGIEQTKGLNEAQIQGVSKFAYWNGVLAKKEMNMYELQCGSCSSFCSGGSCTTGNLNTGYLAVKKA